MPDENFTRKNNKVITRLWPYFYNKCVAVDVKGPIQPLPGCYILTLLDLVTGYPKDVLLKGPKLEKVMEALIGISCITGVLKEMFTIKINN